MDLREISCEDVRWMELAEDRVQWQALVLAVLFIMSNGPDSLSRYSDSLWAIRSRVRTL
jgi:hypothetical protein